MRPFVFINVAMSADGKISTRERRQVKISGKQDLLRTDMLKAGSDAVMVGIGTVLADNPSLTVKTLELREQRVAQGKDEHPIRVVVDSRGRTPPGADILHKGTGQRIIAVSKRAPFERLKELERYATIVTAGEQEVDLVELFEFLHRHGVRRLMVEGGGTLIWSLFSRGLVDEVQTFVGNMVIGGSDAPTPVDGEGFLREEDFVRLRFADVTPLDGGVLIRWRVKQ